MLSHFECPLNIYETTPMGINTKHVIRRIGEFAHEEPILDDPIAMIGLNIVPIREGVLKKK
jgi:hypothetical protein